MNIVQTFYDRLAGQYDQLFEDWDAAVREQAALLEGLFRRYGLDRTARVLDCACGIGTQAIGLAALGYDVTASDLSPGALKEAKQRASDRGAAIRFAQADFCALAETFPEPFDIVIAMANALPHLTTDAALAAAAESIAGQLRPGGIFVASIRDYDSLLQTRPPYSPPYIHKTERGQRVSFQTWDWEDDRYTLTQYLIADEGDLRVSRFVCAYRAIRRETLSGLFLSAGCSAAEWLFPEETGFYQPILVVKKEWS